MSRGHMIDDGIAVRGQRRCHVLRAWILSCPARVYWTVKKLFGHQLVTLFWMKLSEAAAMSGLGPTYGGIASIYMQFTYTGLFLSSSSLLLMLLFRLSDIGELVNMNGLKTKQSRPKNSTAAVTPPKNLPTSAMQVQLHCLANFFLTFL